MPAITDSQPYLYKALLPEFLQSDIPEESKATCSNCAMCEANCDSKSVLREATSDEDAFFSPNVKCCTFHPTLPNYLVGAILSDRSPENAKGREAILDKIRDRIGVTPYGIAAPAKYTLLYGSSREFFGRSPAMRCPYFIDEGGGLCSIWQYRDAVCSTYFCKHVAGADGRRFWMTLKSYIASVENQLSRQAIFELFPDYLLSQRHPAEPPARKLDREEMEERSPSPRTYSELWESWEGLELDFFEECYRRVAAMTRDRLRDILGLEGEISLAMLKAKYEAMQNVTLPDKLSVNPNMTVRWLKSGEVVLGAYSELDALALPQQAFQLLQEFRGDTPVREVRETLRREKQSDFSDDVLLSLYRYRVLEESK